MGPGDAELVTFKAAAVLQQADCVFCFDYLKNEVARYVPRSKIDVASPTLMGRFRGQDLKTLSPELRERARQNEEEMATFVPQVRRHGGREEDGRLRRRRRSDDLLSLVLGDRRVRRSWPAGDSRAEFLQCRQRGAGAEHDEERRLDHRFRRATTWAARTSTAGWPACSCCLRTG